MVRFPISLALLTLCALTAGCITPRSFLDPSFPLATYDNVERLPEPISVRVVVTFERFGKHFPAAEPELQRLTERTLRGSGLLLPAKDGAGEFQITVNNFGDAGAAIAQGFGTGLTFGLVGTTIADGYDTTVLITYGGKLVKRVAVKNGIRTAIGNTPSTSSIETTTPAVAFERVIESIILGILVDMQKAGDLPRPVRNAAQSAI